MREIKFRAWCKKHKVMIYHIGSVNWNEQNEIFVNQDIKCAGNEILMQYTRLKDKNGKEIYEGDIVKQTYHKVIGFGDEMESFEGCHVGEVVIVSSGVCLRNPLIYDTDTGKTKTKGYKNIASYRCEVIGNIYENPELLEGN
ncbi:hypothetical protein H9660_05160 [Clostridium sp. Sa3CUN1]|uniref:YopX protein domain-containing protein n=1 Tax=Clostridium gallinarum TaxID=2762246 RepID=A0ABR8Q2A2_9CLOT|nr:YopX family protein [Clostridium gallinarum]MBD7914527.1 hypothetical protein [Clostridium gallinarum]